jgi:hypothetical protein
MEFVLVNGRTPRPQSFCVLCCEPIGESYLREIGTRLSYCSQLLRRSLHGLRPGSRNSCPGIVNKPNCRRH